ncbi:NAD(P)H-binding protein [Streptacidiphilus cavernicola]|uniref:NAD(P)H-binding protein n=1 Tax=Streptacidiphilus cavernicola TaxID=3342716 RepID=A0ABV6VXI9_9ACTN
MIVITGATGTVGRETLKLLRDGGSRAVAVSRDPERATRGESALPEGVRVVGGDPSDPKTLAPVLDGAEALLLSPRAVGSAGAELLGLAAERGVRRVVVLSAVTVEYGGGYARFAEGFRAVEDAAKASGLDWTLLRCADFSANALAWIPQVRATGTVRGAYGGAATAAIHERDIAAVAVRALVEDGHAGQAYALTGPELVNQRKKLRLISEALGEQLAWQEIAPEQVRQGMLAQGLPEDVPDRLLGYLAECLQRPGPSTDTVEQLLGRPALDFEQWAVDHAAAFRK